MAEGPTRGDDRVVTRAQNPKKRSAQPAKSKRAARPRDNLGRDALLEAAREEFANLGYAGATTAGIARRAGLTQPLVHHHFGSKRGLWLAAIDPLFGALAEELTTAAAAKDLTGSARVARLIRVFVLFSGARPQLPRLIRTESRGGGAAFDELYSRWLGKLVLFFEREITLAQESGAVRAVDGALLYFFIVGASTEIFVQPAIAKRAFGLDASAADVIERHARTVVDVLLHGVGPR